MRSAATASSGSTSTESRAGSRPNAFAAISLTLAAASAPLKSSLGSSSAKPARRASTSAASKSLPAASWVRMKFTVPLRIPETRAIGPRAAAAATVSSTGAPPPTEAAWSSLAPPRRAAAWSRAWRLLTTRLLALATWTPRGSSSVHSRAPVSAQDRTSTRISAGAARNASTSSVRATGGATSRSRPGRRTRIEAISKPGSARSRSAKA